jgi:NAD(P)-dependent dehydrogenase (short-subunit alcohol dehydrogenase family)
MTETRSVLVTGCSSGIGLDAARTLKARGWRVLATCRQQDDVDRLAAEGFEAHRLDYADEASIAAAVGAILDATDGRLDAVFHNGAFAIPGFIEDLPTAALREQFEANFFGWHALTRLVLPVMRRQRNGRIVLCSSVLGFVGVRYRGAYVASKHALEGWADCLRLECRDLPIHVSLIQPGPIATRFNANALAGYQRWIDPSTSPRAAELAAIERRYTEDRRPSAFERPPAAVTAKVIHALESDRPRRRYRVTTPTHVAALMRRVAPTAWLDWLMARN